MYLDLDCIPFLILWPESPEDPEEFLKKRISKKTILEKKVKQKEKQELKRYVVQIYNQQYEKFWKCKPDISYIGIEAKDDEEAYRRAATYEILRWRENDLFSDVPFVTTVEKIHGLGHDFHSHKKNSIAKALKQKTDNELEKILGAKEFIKDERDVHNYIAEKKLR